MSSSQNETLNHSQWANLNLHRDEGMPPSSPYSSVVMSGIHLHKISCLAPLIPVMASDHFFPHRRFSHFIKDLLGDKNNNVLSPPRSSVDTKDKVERGRYSDPDWSSLAAPGSLEKGFKVSERFENDKNSTAQFLYEFVFFSDEGPSWPPRCVMKFITYSILCKKALLKCVCHYSSDMTMTCQTICAHVLIAYICMFWYSNELFHDI